MGIDKYKHIVVSSIMAALLSLVLPWWGAGLITLGVGVAKEIYDKASDKGCAEWQDLAADIIGIIIGIL